MKQIVKKILNFFKSKHLKIEGDWEGFYQHNQSLPEIIRNKKIQFTAKIEIANNSKSFHGKIKESAEGIPEISEIIGSLRGDKIEFMKKYQNFYQRDEEGILTIHEGPQYITYTGIFNHFSNRFIGDWKMRTIYEYKNGDKKTFDTTGTWEMFKITNLKK